MTSHHKTRFPHLFFLIPKIKIVEGEFQENSALPSSQCFRELPRHTSFWKTYFSVLIVLCLEEM